MFFPDHHFQWGSTKTKGLTRVLEVKLWRSCGRNQNQSVTGTRHTVECGEGSLIGFEDTISASTRD